MHPRGAPKVAGSGRKKGTRNKDSVPVREKAQALGIDPFEILLYFAAGRWELLGYEEERTPNGNYTIEPQVRVKAAGEACQYLHPKLKQIDAKVSSDRGLEDPYPGVSNEELVKFDVS